MMRLSEPQYSVEQTLEECVAGITGNAALREKLTSSKPELTAVGDEYLNAVGTGEGSETDPQVRIAELHKRRDEIDAEIARVLAGDIPLLDDTALKDRFQQFMQLARELLPYPKLSASLLGQLVSQQ